MVKLTTVLLDSVVRGNVRVIVTVQVRVQGIIKRDV